MSALPPKADVGTQPRNVRFVPIADITQRSKKSAPAILASRVILDLNQSLSSLPLYRRHSEATANSRREGCFPPWLPLHVDHRRTCSRVCPWRVRSRLRGSTRLRLTLGCDCSESAAFFLDPF